MLLQRRAHERRCPVLWGQLGAPVAWGLFKLPLVRDEAQIERQRRRLELGAVALLVQVIRRLGRVAYDHSKVVAQPVELVLTQPLARLVLTQLRFGFVGFVNALFLVRVLAAAATPRFALQK